MTPSMSPPRRTTVFRTLTLTLTLTQTEDNDYSRECRETLLAKADGSYVAPGTTCSGRRVILVKWSQVSEALLRRVEPERHSVPLFRVIVRLTLGVFGRLLSDGHAQVLGVTLIQDWEDPPPMALVMRINSTLTNPQKRALLGLLRDVPGEQRRMPGIRCKLNATLPPAPLRRC